MLKRVNIWYPGGKNRWYPGGEVETIERKTFLCFGEPYPKGFRVFSSYESGYEQDIFVAKAGNYYHYLEYQNNFWAAYIIDEECIGTAWGEHGTFGNTRSYPFLSSKYARAAVIDYFVKKRIHNGYVLKFTSGDVIPTADVEQELVLDMDVKWNLF